MTQFCRAIDTDLDKPNDANTLAKRATANLTTQTRLDRGQRYVVCAFYTPSYEGHVSRLRESLDGLGLNYHIQEFPARSTWEATTRLKPDFIVDCLERFPEFDVLYVDADAIVHKVPNFFDQVTTDVAMLFAPLQRNSNYTLSIAAGTLYIRNTEGGRFFAKVWSEQKRQAGPMTRDEDMIYMAFPFLEGVSFTALPRAYSKIFDGPGPEPVVEHFQASRGAFKLRRLWRKAGRLGIAAVIVGALSALWW